MIDPKILKEYEEKKTAIMQEYLKNLRKIKKDGLAKLEKAMREEESKTLNF